MQWTTYSSVRDDLPILCFLAPDSFKLSAGAPYFVSATIFRHLQLCSHRDVRVQQPRDGTVGFGAESSGLPTHCPSIRLGWMIGNLVISTARTRKTCFGACPAGREWPRRALFAARNSGNACENFVNTQNDVFHFVGI